MLFPQIYNSFSIEYIYSHGHFDSKLVSLAKQSQAERSSTVAQYVNLITLLKPDDLERII